ncbi:MAG: hypothetical protein ACFFKA_05855, partial [Candidatus Thorarchaeota archaeon]
IVDTTLPNFIALLESEDPLEFGNNEIISINCTDLTGIKQVFIEFEEFNHSMSNVNGDTWQYSIWSPSTTGNHSYTIWIEDNFNNWNYTIGSILVQDKTPPSYSNLIESADPVELGTPLTISIITNDLSDVDQVLIEFEGSNHSMFYFGGDLWRYDSWLPNIIGIYNYTIHMRDNYDNWNFTIDSITFQDTISPTFTNLIENVDPLELGNSVNIRVTVNDYAGINRTLIEFEGNNHSMVNIGGYLWEYSSWTPTNLIVYQYIIHMEDNSGNWNSVIGNITVQDTTPPLAPVITNSPSGDINGILTFDWLDGSDPSGILYYILIIDNETNPFTTPGYVYFFNITNLGSQSSYLEISETPPLGRYYFFLYQIDGVGHQSDYTMGTFTIVSNVNGNPPANDSLIFIITGIILAILIGSTVAIILVRKRVQKTVIPRRKKIPLKEIQQHVNKISNLQFTSETNTFLKGEISNQKNKVISNQGLIDEEQIEVDLLKIKAFGEELFNNGAYLEAQKQFVFAKNMLMKLGRNEEAKLFSDLFQGISGLIEKRENLLKVLDKVKVEGNVVKLFELYYDLIQISKKLRDLDAQDMYRSEFIESLQNNNLALSGLEEYRLIMEEQIKVENNSAKVVELYEKCEIISEFLIQLGREEEKINLDKFRNKRFEFLGE